MKRIILLITSAVCSAVLLSLLISPGAAKETPKPPPTAYNPYPPGILPDDLDSEIARVQSEVNFIENEALTASHALPTPVVTSNPPIIHGSGYQAVETLGKLLNYDLNMS